MHDAIVALYLRTFGRRPESVARIAADGSQRIYWRLSGTAPASVIAAYGPDPDENRAFLSFSSTFRRLGLPVPEIYTADEEQRVWLEEDLGDTTLFQALAAARAPGAPFPAAMEEVYGRVVDVLPRFQVEGGREIDFAVAYPRAAFDAQSMLWDLNYFKYHFLKLAHVPFNEQRLEDDFRRLVEHLGAAAADYFLYRDFQSRNILLRGGQPWFVDYQGGRRGPAQYDVASLLYDAKADLPDEVRRRLLDRYLDALAARGPLDRGRFLALYPGHVVIRIVQALGAYGYRGFYERKPRFLESVPYAARNLAGLLAAGLPVALPELEEVLRRIVDEWAARPPAPAAPTGLRVQVASFSYRDGLPPDDSGHGGGFVFDCRALPNPGRRPEFSGVSGRDEPVARFLDLLPETGAFWEHITGLVDEHLAAFRARGFSDMSVAFGCTGGQHRSVYFAERLARHLAVRHPDARVELRPHARPRWTGAEPPPPGPDAGAGAARAPRAAGETWTR
jgi:aminoglycoside/choline kinase family phosphotransferase